MKKILLFTLAVLTSIFVGGSTVGASGYVNQADVTLMDRVYTSLTEFLEETNNSTSTAESVSSKASTASADLKRLSTHSFSKDLGSSYKEKSEDLKKSAGALSLKIDELDGVLETGDQAAFGGYFTGLEAAVTAFETDIDELNASVDEANASTGNNYLWVVIVTGVVAIAAFVWAFGTKKPANKELLKAKRNVAYGSLAPLAGGLITYLSFVFADAMGGTYFIAWGAVIFGVAVMIRFIVTYFTLLKATPADTPPSSPTPVV